MRPLNDLMGKSICFIWSLLCQVYFDTINTTFVNSPILIFPDPNLDYVPNTDASKYSWSGELTQEKVVQINGKDTASFLHIMYIRGTFAGSQKNWVTLAKEAYAVYIVFKELTYYLYDARVTVKCDHTTLCKILATHTLNSQVNNWWNRNCQHKPCHF